MFRQADFFGGTKEGRCNGAIALYFSCHDVTVAHSFCCFVSAAATVDNYYRLCLQFVLVSRLTANLRSAQQLSWTVELIRRLLFSCPPAGAGPLPLARVKY